MSRIDASRKLRECAELAAGLEGRNPDGLPNGLTVSDDGRLLNWRGVNYVRQSDLPGTGGASHAGDSREKLAADVLRFVREVTDEALVMGAHEASWYPNIGGLRECIAAYLDRQAAITELNCRMKYEGMRDYLRARVGSLTAERDELWQLLKDQEDDAYEVIEWLNAELDAAKTRERELRDKLREKQHVCDVQREPFRKMEADLAATRHAALGLWRRMDALRMAGRAPSQGDLDGMAALLAGVGIEAS